MNSENQYWHLRNHKLFSILSNAQIEDLCIIMGFKKAEKGDIIYLSDEEDKRIYFLKKGKIKIVEVDEKGTEAIREILQQGDLFGELSLDSTGRRTEYAQALTPNVTICTFTLENFEKLMESHPSVALKYSKLVGFRLKQLRNNYSNLVFKDVRSRLKMFLHDWALREGVKNGVTLVVENYLTHQDLAGLVCSTRQTVTQLLNEFEEEGLIKYSRKEIVILDPNEMSK